MWIHPDLLDEVSPWTAVSRKKSRGKTKQANVIIASSIESDSDVNSLTDSEEEEEVLAANAAGPLAAATRSGQLYLRNYDEAPVQQLEPSQEPVTEPAEQPKTTPEKPKEVRYNMTSCIQFGQSPPTPTAVYPIHAVEMRIINSDPHRQQEKGLVRTTIPGGGAMWIHPNLVNEVIPWTTVSRKKSRGKTKQANVIIASSIEPDSDVNSLTDSEEEEEVMAASVAGPLVAATRSGQPYLRNYDDDPVQQLELSQEPVTEPAEQPKTTPEKPKEVRYNRPLNKEKEVEVSQPAGQHPGQDYSLRAPQVIQVNQGGS